MRKLIIPLFTQPRQNKPVQVKPLLYRVFVALISGLWFSFLPLYLVVLYMAERNFFSYEFLSDDEVGMKTLVISAAVFLFVVSIYLFGFLIVAQHAISVGRETGKYDSSRWLTWAFFICSIFMHTLLFWGALLVDKPNIYFGASAFALVLCVYISSFIGGSLRQKLSNWLPTAAFVALTAILPFVKRDVTADLFEIALRQFRVGGGIPVKVKKRDDPTVIVEGRLLLMTSKNLYITPDNLRKTMTIIKNTDDIRVDVENDR